MKHPGKPIYKLDAKVKLLVEVLSEKRHLHTKSVACLAEAMSVKYRTLQSAMAIGRISNALEEALCRTGDFSAEDTSWCDPLISADDRADLYSEYAGRDTPDKFRDMLRRRWQLNNSRYRAIGDRPVAIDRDMACHELSDCGQSVELDSELELLLQTDFGLLHDQNGLTFGFSKARLRLDVLCQYGATTRARFGRGERRRLGSATIAARGTDRQPSWDIAADQAGGAVLTGELCTTDQPLLSLVDHGPGTRIDSTLSVNLFDGVVCLSEGEFTDLPRNKKALIEHICAMEFTRKKQENGSLDLSFHPAFPKWRVV